MICLLYLTYKKDYSFDNDKAFVSWLLWMKDRVHITHILIVDNFNDEAVKRVFEWNGIAVEVVAGNNQEREFSGYLEGMRQIPVCRQYILLNDTFVQPKHHAYSLLGPAIKASLDKVSKSDHLQILGEVNRAPSDAKYRGAAGVSWISSYCFVFGQTAIGTFVRTLETVRAEFPKSEVDLDPAFIAHVDRQLLGRPGIELQAWRTAKYQATASEIRLSQLLANAGVAINSFFSVNVSFRLFLKNTQRRLIRKIKFNLGIN